jgi:hypothetical protein
MKAFALLLVLLPIAACSRIESMVAPIGGRTPSIDLIQGQYRGAATRNKGSECAARFDIGLRVTGTKVEGQMVDARANPRSAVKFESFIDLEGELAAIVSTGGEVVVLRGRFLADRFNGTLAPEESLRTKVEPQGRRLTTNLQFGSDTTCGWQVRLSRQP